MEQSRYVEVECEIQCRTPRVDKACKTVSDVDCLHSADHSCVGISCVFVSVSFVCMMYMIGYLYQMISAPHIATVHIGDDVLPITVPGVGLILLPLKYLYLTLILTALILFKNLISQ